MTMRRKPQATDARVQVVEAVERSSGRRDFRIKAAALNGVGSWLHSARQARAIRAHPVARLSNVCGKSCPIPRDASTHDGTTEPLNGLASVSVCTACDTWPTSFGRGAATVRIVPKDDGA